MRQQDAVGVVLRRQIDDQLGPQALLRSLVRPEQGWAATIRQALGQTLQDVATRMGISRQAVGELEQAERRESITIGKLRELANALECDIVVALVPRRPLASIMADIDRARTAETRARVVHTMQLEAQGDGVDAAIDKVIRDEEEAQLYTGETFPPTDD